MLYLQGKISYAAKTYLSDLSNLINNVIGTNDPQSQIYYAFANQAIVYENQISQVNLSASEKDMLWSAFAVARYSAAYWGNYYLNYQNSSSYVTYQPVVVLLKIRLRWIKLILRDVEGAIIGCISAIINQNNIFDAIVSQSVIKSIDVIIDDVIQSIALKNLDKYSLTI